jgi:hypothetical protein
MGLQKLFLRHSARFFLFFEDGDKLFSCKWIHNNSSCGHYEFCESSLGKSVSRLRSEEVEWDEYEVFLSGWLRSNGGFVFERAKIFDLTWSFFLRRNDRFLADSLNPMLVYESLNAPATALDLVSKTGLEAAGFWNSKASEIISKYAHWLAGFRG